MREIPNSDLLVSVHHSFHSSAKFSIFDLSKERGGVASIFDSDEITGGGKSPSLILFFVFSCVFSLDLTLQCY